MAETAEAVLHDGSIIPVSIRGEGPALLLPVRLEQFPADQAETMRKWGGDPDLGPALVAGLSRTNRLIVADYEGHRMAHPAADTLTPGNLAADLLAIADAGGAGAFGYYGYSWLALAGLQVAVRTNRLRALALGGFPPWDGPYRSMLAVTRAAHAASIQSQEPSGVPIEEAEPGDWDSAVVQTTEAQTRQFVTLYEALQDFDDVAASVPPRLARLAFAGSDDQIDYSKQWGGVRVSIGEPLARHRDALLAAGWDVQVLPGLDHLGAMHSSVVLPILVGWLRKVGWVRH
ncbi:MAG: alpha/beta hydrolase [Arthrobacter sp.]